MLPKCRSAVRPAGELLPASAARSLRPAPPAGSPGGRRIRSTWCLPGRVSGRVVPVGHRCGRAAVMATASPRDSRCGTPGLVPCSTPVPRHRQSTRASRPMSGWGTRTPGPDASRGLCSARSRPAAGGAWPRPVSCCSAAAVCVGRPSTEQLTGGGSPGGGPPPHSTAESPAWPRRTLQAGCHGDRCRVT